MLLVLHVFRIVRSNVCICLRESVNQAVALFVPDFLRAHIAPPCVFHLCFFFFSRLVYACGMCSSAACNTLVFFI
jgi:hypothetical protein